MVSFSHPWCTVMPYWCKCPGSHGRCCSNDSPLGVINLSYRHHVPPLFCMCFCLFLDCIPVVSCQDNIVPPKNENLFTKYRCSVFARIRNFLVHAQFVQTKTVASEPIIYCTLVNNCSQMCKHCWKSSFSCLRHLYLVSDISCSCMSPFQILHHQLAQKYMTIYT